MALRTGPLPHLRAPNGSQESPGVDMLNWTWYSYKITQPRPMSQEKISMRKSKC